MSTHTKGPQSPQHTTRMPTALQATTERHRQQLDSEGVGVGGCGLLLFTAVRLSGQWLLQRGPHPHQLRHDSSLSTSSQVRTHTK
jgi:hypothetical protein